MSVHCSGVAAKGDMENIDLLQLICYILVGHVYLTRVGYLWMLHKALNNRGSAFALALQYVAASVGLAKGDMEKLTDILMAVPEVSFICVDVANGYSEHFVQLVKQVRAANPTHTIMVGHSAPLS